MARHELRKVSQSTYILAAVLCGKPMSWLWADRISMSDEKRPIGTMEGIWTVRGVGL